MQQEIIHRHWFIYAITALKGGIVMALLFLWVGFFPFPEDWLNTGLLMLAVVVGLVTIIRLWVLYLTAMTLNASGISIKNWSTLFASSNTEVDWNSVQSVTVQQPGIFSQWFDYGTILIQTADARPNLIMSDVPTAEAWKAFIDEHAQLGSQVGDGA